MAFRSCTTCAHFYKSAEYCDEHHKPKNGCWEPKLKWGATVQKHEKEGSR